MHLTFKFIIVGDQSVGKSALMVQFTEQKFEEEGTDATIGIELGEREIKVGENTVVKLEIWDTAGQERFMAVTRAYYKGADGALVVFDVTKCVCGIFVSANNFSSPYFARSRESFSHVTRWIDELKRGTDNEHLSILIVGSKADLADRRWAQASPHASALAPRPHPAPPNYSSDRWPPARFSRLRLPRLRHAESSRSRKPRTSHPGSASSISKPPPRTTPTSTRRSWMWRAIFTARATRWYVPTTVCCQRPSSRRLHCTWDAVPRVVV